MKHISITTFIISLLICVNTWAADRKWENSPEGLPYFSYEGVCTLDNDPGFLIGNSRIKVNTHSSGIYELISGERSWARFNADPRRPDYGKNRATVRFGNKEFELVGPSSLAGRKDRCKVYGGAGFTRYDYQLDNGISCSRMISVMPSDDPEKTEPFFLVSVTFSNNGSLPRKIQYDEAISPLYVPSSYQLIPENERSVTYPVSTEISFRCIKASFGPVPQKFVHFAAPQDRSADEFAPQSLFIYCDNAFLVVNDGQLKASVNEFRLRPKSKHTIYIVIGFSGENNREAAERFISKAGQSEFGAFATKWKEHLPSFSSERNDQVRYQLYESAYELEASAVYSDYFKETFIPGKFYSSASLGENYSNSDHINAALYYTYTDPQLAKSMIRYVMKQTSFDGIVPEGSRGYGYIPTSSYTENQIHVEVLNAVSEYLKRTGDYDFLDEWMPVYPIEKGELQCVRIILEKYFMLMRERRTISSAEMAMQAAYLPKFAEQAEKSGRLSEEFKVALNDYTKQVVDRFVAKGEYYVSDLPYILEVKELSNARKRELVDDAIGNGYLNIRSVPGLAGFDGMEANSLFRSCVQNSMGDDVIGVVNAWTLYSYYRLMEY